MVNYYKDDLSHVFYALADQSRREILDLVGKRPRRATDLARRFDISMPAVSKHIRILEEAGFVKRNVVGREHQISIEKKSMDKAYSWIEKHRKYWEASLDRLENYLRKTQQENKND